MLLGEISKNGTTDGNDSINTIPPHPTSSVGVPPNLHARKVNAPLNHDINRAPSSAPRLFINSLSE
jgi:hypothetical protein